MIIEEMQTYYSQRAPYYDTSMGYDDAETVASLSPVIDELQQIVKDKHLLELACGPCNLS